jgi:hypothetical protein
MTGKEILLIKKIELWLMRQNCYTMRTLPNLFSILNAIIPVRTNITIEAILAFPFLYFVTKM